MIVSFFFFPTQFSSDPLSVEKRQSQTNTSNQGASILFTLIRPPPTRQTKESGHHRKSWSSSPRSLFIHKSAVAGHPGSIQKHHESAPAPRRRVRMRSPAMLLPRVPFSHLTSCPRRVMNRSRHGSKQRESSVERPKPPTWTRTGAEITPTVCSVRLGLFMSWFNPLVTRYAPRFMDDSPHSHVFGLWDENKTELLKRKTSKLHWGIEPRTFWLWSKSPCWANKG